MATKGKEISSTERKIIVDLRNNGNSFRQIGEIIGRNHSSIQRVLKNYDTDGILSARPRTGRPSKYNAKETHSLGNIIKQNVKMTDPKGTEMIEKNFHKKVNANIARRTLTKLNYHTNCSKPIIATAVQWNRKLESYDYTQSNISSDYEYYASHINPTETTQKGRMPIPTRNFPSSNWQRNSIDNNNQFPMNVDETAPNGSNEEEQKYHCSNDSDIECVDYLGQELVTKIETSEETMQNGRIHPNNLTAIKIEPDENSVNEDLIKLLPYEDEWEVFSSSNSSPVTCKKEVIEDIDLLREEDMEQTFYNYPCSFDDDYSEQDQHFQYTMDLNIANDYPEQQWSTQFEKCEVHIQNQYSTSTIFVEVKKEKDDEDLHNHVVRDKDLETYETSSTPSNAYPNSVNDLKPSSDQLQCPTPSLDATDIQRFFQARNQGVEMKRKEISSTERKIIVELRNEGKSFRQIGEIIGRNHSSIQRVLKNYDTDGILSAKPRSGRPSKLNTLESEALITTITQNPRITAVEMVEIIQQKFDKRIHADTARKILRKYNYHCSLEHTIEI